MGGGSFTDGHPSSLTYAKHVPYETGPTPDADRYEEVVRLVPIRHPGSAAQYPLMQHESQGSVLEGNVGPGIVPGEGDTWGGIHEGRCRGTDVRKGRTGMSVLSPLAHPSAYTLWRKFIHVDVWPLLPWQVPQPCQELGLPIFGPEGQ